MLPEYGKGRQVVIANRLKVSQEAVRKWFEAESIPRPQKMKQLASFLGVDHAWLGLGVKPGAYDAFVAKEKPVFGGD